MRLKSATFIYIFEDLRTERNQSDFKLVFQKIHDNFLHKTFNSMIYFEHFQQQQKIVNNANLKIIYFIAI